MPAERVALVESSRTFVSGPYVGGVRDHAEKFMSVVLPVIEEVLPPLPWRLPDLLDACDGLQSVAGL